MTSEDPIQTAAATQLLDEATHDLHLDRDVAAVMGRGTTIRRRRRLLRTIPLGLAVTAALALGLPGVPGQRLPDALAGWGPKPLSLTADDQRAVEAACAEAGRAAGGDATIMDTQRPTFTNSVDQVAQAVYVSDTVTVSCVATWDEEHSRWRVEAPGSGSEQGGPIVSEPRARPLALSPEEPLQVEASYGMAQVTVTDDGTTKVNGADVVLGRVHPSVAELQVISGGKRYRASISDGLFIVRLPSRGTVRTDQGTTKPAPGLPTATAYDASGKELATVLLF